MPLDLLDLLDEPAPSLARVASLIGQHVHIHSRGPWSPTSLRSPSARPPIESPDQVQDRIQEMAATLPHGSDADTVITHVFGSLGFHGNPKKYYEANNSIIQRVLESRTGIPLTLAIVAIEVAASVNVVLSPIGMPGHFLVGDGYDPDRFFDPFAGGRELNSEGCERIFNQIIKDGNFETDMLRPISPTSIAARLLQNLRVVYLRHGDVAKLASVLELRVELRGASADERLEYSKILGALGRFDQAAEQRDKLAELQPERSDRHEQAAAAHRARRN